MTITMIALKPLVYAGARIAKGGKFEVRGRSDVRILQALERAEPVEAVVPAKLPSNPPSNYGVPIPIPYGNRKLTATLAPSVVAVEPAKATEVPPEPVEPKVIESTEAVETTDVQPKPKRQYRRRDMTASDSSET